jgi:hypothetical protein
MYRPAYKIVLLALWFVSVFMPALICAQSPGTVQGTVTDGVTGAPLENTNVYLSSTTRGSNTGKDGKYVLNGVPPGVFQLVASRVGYRVKSQLIHAAGDHALRADFALEPVTLQGEEVQVLAHVDREWNRLLGKFREAFLGDGDNAAACTIINPEVLDFRIEKGTDILFASTDSVLRIENRALGYRLFARLGVFEWDIEADRGKFVLYPRFETMVGADSEAETRYHTNRVRSYRGSMKHFLSSLAAGRLAEEGFLVSSGTLTELRGGLFRPLAPEDFTLTPVRGESLWELTLERWLRVEYRGEESRLRSFIGLSGKTAVFDSAGDLTDPLCVQVVGDWSRYRVPDMLPLY